MRQRIFLIVLTAILMALFSATGSAGVSSLDRNAEIALSRGQFEYAYAQWKKVLKRMPGDSAAIAGLAKIEGIARDSFEESLMLQAIEPERARENLMTVLLITDSWSELNREARNLLGDGVSYVNHGPYRPLAELLEEFADMPNSRKKISILKRIAARYPSSPVPHYLIGKILESKGDRRGAVREYQRAVKIRATCALCREALGQLLTRGSDDSIGPTIP